MGIKLLREIANQRWCPSHRKWGAKCYCGKMFTVRKYAVDVGTTKSCGCLRVLRNQELRSGTKHGKWGTGAWKSWCNMLRRCNDSNSIQYGDYGGRGIKVCDDWSDFETFYVDMGDRPSGHSLDRKAVDGDYCKDNCKWSTKYEQANNKTNNVTLTYNDRTLTLAQWGRETGTAKYSTLYYRMKVAKWTKPYEILFGRTK